MQRILPILIVIHVVPGIFWAGSTFVLARLEGAGAEQLGYPQMGAATTTVLAGVVRAGSRTRRGLRHRSCGHPKRHRLACDPSSGRGERSGTQSSSGSYRLQPAGRCGPAGDHDHLHVGRPIHLMPPIHVASVNPRTSPESAAFG